jgi:FSR family fosmidomycin resistance protein-like MFS transporter
LTPVASEAKPQQPTENTASAREDSELSLLRNGSLLTLGAGHGMVDLCANTMPVFYPIIATTLSLSYASIGALSTVQTIFSSLSQPVFGWLADRFGSRVIAPASVLLAAAAIASAGFIGSYYALLVMVATVGLASGAFHPQGAKGAALLGGRWKTTALSLFMILGNLGFSFGPLLAAMVLVPAGMKSTAILLVPGILVALSLLFATKKIDRADMAKVAAGRMISSGVVSWSGVAAAVGIIISRFWVEYSMIAFVPLLFAARGAPPELAGQILFLIFSMGAIGTALGGWLADRFGRRIVAVASFMMLVPLVHFFLSATSWDAALLAFLLGLTLGLTGTLPLVTIQEALPSRMGMASGIANSSGMIMGGLGVAMHGVIADSYGIETSLQFVIVIVLIGAAASLLLPNRARQM